MERSRRTILIVLVLVIILAATASYGFVRLESSQGTSSAPNPRVASEIDVIPSDSTKSACITGTPGVPRPTLPLAFGTLQGNTYSVPNGTVGHVGMCYRAESGSLFSYANWSRVGPSGGWFSYPSVAYGVNDYDGDFTTYTNQSSAWELPQTVASAVNRSLWVTATYDLNAPNSSDVDGYDLSFDNFFSATLPPTLQVAPFVEVEIFLAHNISYPFHWAPWSTETLVNTSVAVTPWDVAYYCHGVDNSSNGNISFDFSFGGQGGHGLAEGTVGVNLSALLSKVESMISTASCWTGPSSDFSSFYLGQQDLGSEDGALGGTSFDYNWTVDSYCLHLQVNSTNPDGVECDGASPAGTASVGPPSPEGSGPGVIFHELQEGPWRGLMARWTEPVPGR